MSDSLAGLPDEVAAAIAPHLEQDPQALDAISLAIAKRRDEAVAARTGTGIEAVWTECEEAYVGIDDVNRNEYGSARWAKPMSPEGPITTDRRPQNKNVKSTVFVRLTARYVDAGTAKLCEILLPPDDKAFSFSEMPVPELLKAKEDKSQVVHDGMGNAPLMRAPKPGETVPAQPATPQPTPLAPAAAASASPQTAAPAPGGAPAAAAPAVGAPAQPQVPLTVADLAEEKIEMARKSAKLAEDRVYNWMVECGYTREVRKVIFDAARCGTGILKGPVAMPKRGMMVKKTGEDGVAITVEDKIFPGAKWCDFWNIFPDPACGEDIHDGDYVLERDFLSERQVRRLKDQPFYIASQIDKVLVEGPDKINVNKDGADGNKADEAAKRKNRFQVWYYYGALKRDEYACLQQAATGKALADTDVPPDQNLVYAICTLINDTVVRATINPLDSGEFPYHSFPWQRRAGSCWGIGVSEQMRVPQRVVNASTRAMLNNAGKSAGSQIVVDRGSIIPANGSWTIEPDKIWWKKADAQIADVRMAFMAIDIPNVTDQMMKIIQYGMQLAEESTSIPLITQGQSGETTPDTFGAAQLQNNNANQLLRSIGYSFDDYITEPVVRQFYEWLLLDPDVSDEEKGEFEINAHGSIALVERAIMDQTIAQMGQVVLNPAYGLDPKRWAKQFLKSKRFSPDDFKYTPEEQARIDANPIKPVQVQVAEANAASREKIAGGEQAIETQKVQNDQHEVLTDATVELHKLQLQERLAMLEYANREKVSINQVKAELAKTAMQLQTEKELNAANNSVDLHKHHTAPKPAPGQRPAVQVPGRAGNGKAFSQAK